MEKEFLEEFQNSHNSGYELGQTSHTDTVVELHSLKIGENKTISLIFEYLKKENLRNFNLDATLFCLSRIDGNKISSEQKQFVQHIAQTNKDYSVLDNCIRCFEGWGDEESLDLLSRVKFEHDWLEDYKNQVIA